MQKIAPEFVDRLTPRLNRFMDPFLKVIVRQEQSDHAAIYEIQNWKGWHRQQTLSLIAIWFLVAELRRGKMDTGYNPSTGARFHTPVPPKRLNRLSPLNIKK